MKISWKHIALLILIAISLDQISKIIVINTMSYGESISVLGDWFKLLYIENPGAAYGMSLDALFSRNIGKLILSIVRLVFITGIIIYLIKLHKNNNTPKGVIIAFALITAGALGNMIDSAFYGLFYDQYLPADVQCQFLYGNVVDMLYFPIIDITKMPSWIPVWGDERFIFFSPIFNLADSYISCAAIYLILFQRNFFK